jgi:uncharacterized protein (DUF3084 family)
MRTLTRLPRPRTTRTTSSSLRGVPTWVPSLIAIVLGVLGSGGMLALLRFQRQEAGKMLEQHQIILHSMQTVVDEATEAFERIRADRDQSLKELRDCHTEAHALRDELVKLRWEARPDV